MNCPSTLPWALLALLCACARTAPAPAAQPRTAAAAHAAATETRCVVRPGGKLRCSFEGGAQQAWAPVRGHAIRERGGVFVVDAEGALLRFDRQGRPTGAWPVGAHSVAAAGRMVCVGTIDGALACGLDRFDPAGCEPAQPPDLFVLGEATDGPLHVASDDERLCTVGPDGTRRCLHVRAVCERHCLRYPACGGPLRCVDPCADAEMLPLIAEPAPDEFFQQQARLR